jgi:hypothetical protein
VISNRLPSHEESTPMGRSIYRELPTSARDALIRVSQEQFRTPDQQAAKYVLDGLKKDRALSDHKPAGSPVTRPAA